MADESIIVDLKTQGVKDLVDSLGLASKGLSELDKTLANANKELATLDKGSQEFKNLTKEINAANTATKAYNESTDTLKKDLRDTTNEIGQLERALKELEKTGQKNTQVYKDIATKQDELKKKAGQLKDTITDLNAEIKNSGSDTKNLDKALRAIGAVAAGYQIAQGALVLFGSENKKFEQALLKLNAVMAITNGLQQIQNELSKKDSIFTMAAVKAKQLYTIVVGESTGALKGFKVALASTGIGLLVIAVGYLIANFDRLSTSGGVLSKVINSISDTTRRVIQDFKDLTDWLGITTFATDELAEAEKKRLSDLEGLYELDAKRKIGILKAQHKDTADEELKEFKRKRDALIKEQKQAKDGEDKDAQERIKSINELGVEIAIKEAEIEQKKVDDKKKASDKAEKEKDKELKSLQDKQIKHHAKLLKLQEDFRKAKEKREKDAADAEKKRLDDLLEAQQKARIEANKKDAQQQNDAQKRFEGNQKNLALVNEKYINDRDKANKLRRKREEEAEQEHANKVAFILQELSNIADVIGNITQQAISIRATNEINFLEEKRKKGLITEKQFERESAKIKEEAAKKQRAADIAIAVAKIPLIFLQALVSAPFPFGVILASIASGIALAQVAILAASPLPQFKHGGQVSEKLGLIKGKSHQQGGVPIEVEGDEYVMPVKETRENLEVLQAIHKGKFKELFIPKANLIQPDIFANIPNPAMIDKPLLMDKDDYSSINTRLDKVANELWWLRHEAKTGNKISEKGTDRVVKAVQSKSKRYV